MILHGNQRGGAKNLAIHLMKPENERVEVHELRGFVSGTLEGAFQESYALSRATRCKQHLYSLSISPPIDADIAPEHFVDAANRAEQRLGLEDQPRAIVFHDKRGDDGQLRRHAHAVWCRIDPETMTAKQLSYDKMKLREVSRDLHIEHNLKMPAGLVNSKDRNPRNYTLEQWQQCKRAEKDPKQVKEAFQDCWAISDSKAAFEKALEERGYFLAQGRRGHVAVDYKGEKYAVSRYVGIKAKEVRARLGDAKNNPSLEMAETRAKQQVTDRLKELEAAQRREFEQKRQKAIEDKKRQDTEQAKAQEQLEKKQVEQEKQQADLQASRIRHGILGFWDKLTGRRKKIEAENALEVQQAKEQRQKEADNLARQQALEQNRRKEKAKAERRRNVEAVQEPRTDIKQIRPAPSATDNKRRKAYIDEQRTGARTAQQKRSRDGPTLER